MTSAVALLALLLTPQNDKTRANSYDDVWESAWVTRCQTVLSGGTKTAGFVLQVGDSITHSNPYSQWPRYGSGKTAEDTALCIRIQATTAFPGNATTATSTNGFYLAAADTANDQLPNGNRGMSAAGGISALEFLTGTGNGAAPMASVATEAAAQTTVSTDNTDDNLHITTVAAAFMKAQFAVLMLGTNDLSGRTAGQFIADLTTIVNAFEAQKIAVVVSTIPPHFSNDATVQQYNTQIRSFAQSRSLPLIDFYAEILARRSGTSWNGTLMNLNDVHPSGSYVVGPTTFNSDSDPYASGGNAATHLTGVHCDNIGYLLRSWLTVQKLKEVYAYVIDGTPVPGGGGGGGGGGGSPPPAPAASNDDNDTETCGCGSVAAGFPGWAGLGAALLLLGALRRR